MERAPVVRTNIIEMGLGSKMRKFCICLLALFVSGCISGSNNSVSKEVGGDPIVGIWVIDKDKMQQEKASIFGLAKARAAEINTDAAGEQLKRLDKRLQEDIESQGKFMRQLNSDGSGATFPSLAGFNGRRGPFVNPTSLLLWTADEGKVNVKSIRRPYLLLEIDEFSMQIDGNHLLSVKNNTLVKDIKQGEDNLLVLFGFEKYYYKKVGANDPAARKLKVLHLVDVELEIPEGFVESRIRNTAGIPHASKEIYNKENRKEQIEIEENGVWELGAYNMPDGEKLTPDQALKKVADSVRDELLKKYPEAKLKLKYTKLDGEKAVCIEGQLGKENKKAKVPLYIKKYVMLDDGVGSLEINIFSDSKNRVRFMDRYVNTVRLNMTKTWNVTRQQVLDAMQQEVNKGGLVPGDEEKLGV